MGKQLKEKLNQKQAAEEAEEASPAEGAVIETQEKPEAEPAAAETPGGIEQSPGEITEEPAPESALTDAPEEEPSGEDPAGQETEELSPEYEVGPARITDEALAEILLAFGWRIPNAAHTVDVISVSEASMTAPALEELAAEVSSAMQGFTEEGVSVYEEDTTAHRREAEDIPAQSVLQTTAVFHAIGSETGEEQIEAVPEEKPEQPEDEELLQERPDSKTLFSGMNQDILKEVFSEEELSELEGDATHVFKKEEMDDLSDIQKQTETEEEPKQESPKQENPEPEQPERRRTRKAAGTGETQREKLPKEKARRSREEEEPEFTARDYRPIRRKRSYRTGLRGGLMYFGFVICVSVILASVAWLAADDVLSLNKDYVEAEVYVGENLDMKQVSDELYNKGLIKYKWLFRIFAKLMKADTKIDPGVYTLSTKLDYNAMVHAMHQSEAGPEKRATVMVMIPEGKTLKQTFQILSDHGVCPYETLLECSANHDFKYDFLEDLPYGEETRLEGYLFPDTYEFYAPSEPEEAIERFLSNFNSKVTLDMRQQAADMGYSLRELLTVASLVEMEAGKDTERATIASVIYNRLNSSYYPYLQIDATIQYALEERKESLTNADLEIESPYNTYKYTGLPPGPIANPGMASIRAALGPESTGYYFYALNKNGSHNFFATMDQFEYFVNSSEFGG